MDAEGVKETLLENRTLAVSSAAILGLYFFIQLYLLQTHMHGYDSFRDLTIVKEIAERGTFSYFGQGYVVNPPLSYLMRGFIAKIAGFSLFTQKAFSIIMYFIGQIILYLTARQFWDRRKSLYVFLIGALSWSFVMATRLRSFAYMLLFGTLLFYTYIRYMRESSLRNAALVGVAAGIGMLAKSSMAFLIAVIGLHAGLVCLMEGEFEDFLDFFTMGAVAGAIYTPYLAYNFLNGLSMPWTAQMMSITGEAAWMQNFTPEWHLILYQRLAEFYPVMMSLSLGGIILFRDKVKENFSTWTGFTVLLLLVGPLLGRIVLTKVHLYQLFFLFIPLPILTVWTLDNFRKEYSFKIEAIEKINCLNTFKAAVGVLVIIAGAYGTFQIQQNTVPSGEYFSEDFKHLTENMDESDTVLSEKSYVKLHALSDGYVENSGEPARQNLLVYNADKYISKDRENKEYLYNEEKIRLGGENYLYQVNRSQILESMNLDSRELQLVNDAGKPVSHGRCVIAGENWKMTQVSGRDGTITAPIPVNYTGPQAVMCRALGYSEYRGRIPTNNQVNLGTLNTLIHGYSQTRY